MNKFKKIVAVISAAATFAVSGIAAFADTYTDVPTTHWAYDAVERCSRAMWFSGYPDGSFHPDASITRGEAVKVFVDFLSIPVSQPTSTEFTDLKLNAWYAPYVEAGAYLFPERTTPQGQKIFQADFPVTREDTIYALVKALRYDKLAEFADQSVLNMFTDQNSITSKLKPYVSVALSYGLASGYGDGTIGGQDPLTRAQFASLLYRGNTIGPLDDNDDNVVMSSVTFNPTTLKTVTVGDSFDITANATYTNGSSKAFSTDLTLVSDNTSVAVTNRNKVTAVGAGQAIITCANAGMGDYKLVVMVNAPTDAPVITLDSYEASTEAETAVIKGKVTDATGTPLTLTVNGEEVGLTSDGSFTKTVNLAIGANSISLTAKNGYGNAGSQTASIERKAAPTPAPTAAPTAAPTPAPTEAPELPADIVIHTAAPASTSSESADDEDADASETADDADAESDADAE